MKNGKAKKYDYNGKLEFEGEYKYGEIWNGGIRQYFENKNDIIIEYNNGEKTGRIKELNHLTGKLIFEGQYSNGIKNGYGKEYNNEGEVIFEGEYKDGKRWNGEGIEYNHDKLIFEGIYINGEKYDVK